MITQIAQAAMSHDNGVHPGHRVESNSIFSAVDAGYALPCTVKRALRRPCAPLPLLLSQPDFERTLLDQMNPSASMSACTRRRRWLRAWVCPSAGCGITPPAVLPVSVP